MPTATIDQITHTVTDIAATEIGLPTDQLTADTDLRAIEGMDSVKVLRMIAKIERAYDIEMEDEDVFGVSRISEVAAVVERTLRDRDTRDQAGTAGDTW